MSGPCTFLELCLVHCSWAELVLQAGLWLWPCISPGQVEHQEAALSSPTALSSIEQMSLHPILSGVPWRHVLPLLTTGSPPALSSSPSREDVGPVAGPTLALAGNSLAVSSCPTGLIPEAQAGQALCPGWPPQVSGF